MKIALRKLRRSDLAHFSRWWRDEELAKFTSGKMALEKDIPKYFYRMMQNKNDLHFIIMRRKQAIGHVALGKRSRGWYEIQIIIGEKEYWGQGYGAQAITQLLRRARRSKIKKIFLMVRKDNTRAVSAYETAGFKKTADFDELMRMEVPRKI